MGREVDSNLQPILDANSCEAQTTLELTYADGTTTKRFATDILSVSGNSFSDDLIRSDSIAHSIDQAVERVEVKVQNVDKIIGKEIRAGDVHFAKASLGRYFRNLETGTEQWRELFFGEIIPLGYNERHAKLEILDEMVAAGRRVCNWTLSPTCIVKFKGTKCGYTGSKTTCNKHLRSPDGCAGRNNTHRFVGTPLPIIENEAAPPATPPPPPISGGGYGGGSGGYGGGGYTKDGFEECLVGDTLILMGDSSYKRIEAIEAGETVIAFDRFGDLHEAKVLQKFNSIADKLIKMKFYFGELILKENHPILTSSFQFQIPAFWKEEKSLYLNLRGGLDWILNDLISKKELDLKDVEVFNLEVENFYTYIANGIPVHNYKPAWEDPEFY